jgi:hypothetical protein
MLGLFKRKPTPASDRKGQWRALVSDGVAFATLRDDLPSAATDVRLLDNPAVFGLLVQLEDDGRLTASGELRILPWGDVYDLLEGQEQREIRDILTLPNGAEYVPSLVSIGSLRDRTFDIVVQSWRAAEAGRPSSAHTCGAVVVDGDEIHLLPRMTWELVDQVASFQDRPDVERSEAANRRYWGRIRRTAIVVGARLDDFLFNSIVLTPERLQIGLRKDETGGSKVVEVIPTFEGAPDRWLESLDTHGHVLDRYNIPTPNGVVAIEIAPEIRTILENVKRMPGRRVAGARAEAFLVNPFAALGEAAAETIDEAQFMEAREKADLLFERFFAEIDRDALGYPTAVSLRIESPRAAGPFETEVRPFADDAELGEFIAAVEMAINRDNQLCGWDGYNFEIMGETEAELGILREALTARSKPRVLVSYTSIYDLSAYSGRIEGIGAEKPFYSPYIAKKSDDEGWFPENIFPVISWLPEGESKPIAAPLTPELKERIREKCEEAISQGHDTFELKGFTRPFPVKEAQAILETVLKVEGGIRNGNFDPRTVPTKEGEPRHPVAPRHLVIRANIQAVDYTEARRDILESGARKLDLPPGLLRDEVQLKDHQSSGVAWLQHLFRKAPAHCRGAVLADDMGLGKTLQLLTLLAWAFTREPSLPPALVVAPVSLLENWEQEAKKFLVDGVLRLLVAYGDALATLKVPRESVDEQLRKEGLVRFLRPGWLGSANVVLTTYETLRDLEFSFAAVKWSVVVCDEAQRIKNPNAMTTRAAKKMNVTFRIACTGTPVENTLTDLWCLFDFVQPGLLGALSDFGTRYRRPIEAETDEEKARVEELRAMIAPQILRRTKEEAAKDLPRRHDSRVEIPLSSFQRTLYANAIEQFKRRGQDRSPFKNHLGLLHYLRQICTDPHEVGFGVFKPEPLSECRVRSPKLDWILNQLKEIEQKREKVIIFCEFREIQRMLRHYIEEVFEFAPDIVNGDTAASAKHIASRHKRISAFQGKPGFGVIILSPVAVGFGVNIQEANHVIHFTRHWNPAKEDQATDRAHRIGQTKPVWVYCPVLVAPEFLTFDVKLDRLLGIKRGLAQDMLNGSGDVGPRDFALDDMVPAHEQSKISPTISIDDVIRMEWDYFECFVAALWLKRGYKSVYKTPARDDGVDVVALNGRLGSLIQCKTSSIDGHQLGWEGIKDVVTGQAAYARRYPGVSLAKVCVTNQFFNATARKHAEMNDVETIDQCDLERLLEAHEVRKLDVEALLYADWENTA